jgi:hypothetical protein
MNLAFDPHAEDKGAITSASISAWPSTPIFEDSLDPAEKPLSRHQAADPQVYVRKASSAKHFALSTLVHLFLQINSKDLLFKHVDQVAEPRKTSQAKTG